MCPSEEDLINAIEHNVIGHNEYRRSNGINTNKLWGKDIATLKGKTTRKKSKLPREDEAIDIPSPIVERYKDGLMLSIDIMHVNKICFLVSKAYHLNYYQCIPIRKKGKEYILDAIETMCNEYKQRGVFKVTQTEEDGAFECTRSDLQSDRFGNIRLITCDAQKHVPRIERGIRELKD